MNEFFIEHLKKRVNRNLPLWMIERLDYEAKRLGVARQAIMKMFLAQHLEKAG